MKRLFRRGRPILLFGLVAVGLLWVATIHFVMVSLAPHGEIEDFDTTADTRLYDLIDVYNQSLVNLSSARSESTVEDSNPRTPLNSTVGNQTLFQPDAAESQNNGVGAAAPILRGDTEPEAVGGGVGSVPMLLPVIDLKAHEILDRASEELKWGRPNNAADVITSALESQWNGDIPPPTQLLHKRAWIRAWSLYLSPLRKLL